MKWPRRVERIIELPGIRSGRFETSLVCRKPPGAAENPARKASERSIWITSENVSERKSEGERSPDENSLPIRDFYRLYRCDIRSSEPLTDNRRKKKKKKKKKEETVDKLSDSMEIGILAHLPFALLFEIVLHRCVRFLIESGAPRFVNIVYCKVVFSYDDSVEFS